MLETKSECSTVRVLLIDDDIELCELVSEYLRPEGFEVDVAHDGAQGAARAVGGEHGLVILDVMLPGFDGFEVLRRIRKASSVPVMMLTARGDDVDRIVGLEIGADDYLPKPFNPRELLARIRAILRRAPHPSLDVRLTSRVPRLIVGDVEVESGARIVRRGGVPVELTAVEFSLLETLLRSAGQVVQRYELSKVVLGRTLMPYDRSIDMHVSNLRKKLGHMNGPVERIKTIRGVGYIYTLPDTSDAPPGNTDPDEDRS